MITDINQLDFDKTYTYADYLTWEFEERTELYKGKLFEIGLAPGTLHQKISGNLVGLIWELLKINPIIFLQHLLMFEY